MRRALIALQVQTPQPLVTRLPVVCYYVSMAVLIFLVALVSTRSALIYRSQLHALEARVLYVQRSNQQQQQTRSAALIAFQNRPDFTIKASKPPVALAQAEPVTELAPEPITEPVPVSVPEPKVAIRQTPAEALTTKITPKSRVVISSSLSKAAQPESVEIALQRLRFSRDDVALRWLASRVDKLRKNPSWPVFRHLASETNSAESFYQLGVLLGAIGDTDQGVKWLSKANSLKADVRYQRAFAIAADRQGLRSVAISAYRRYLAHPAAFDTVEIRARLSTLEAS